MGLGSTKSPKTLVGRTAHQGIQTQTDGIGIRGRTAGHLRLSEEVVINVEGFFHANDYAIKVCPYCLACARFPELANVLTNPATCAWHPYE
ncbi:MAG: hypothetical protein M3Y07_07080, partial [Acidobacteriota bacterium]|nr:hypothetical protein [Acidobacteriota bacterium]